MVVKLTEESLLINTICCGFVLTVTPQMFRTGLSPFLRYVTHVITSNHNCGPSVPLRLWPITGFEAKQRI